MSICEEDRVFFTKTSIPPPNLFLSFLYVLRFFGIVSESWTDMSRWDSVPVSKSTELFIKKISSSTLLFSNTGKLYNNQF